MKNFSIRLKELRKEKKLTQQEFANNLKIKRANVAKWETDKAIPDVETIQKIADYFEVNSRYLLGKSDERNLLIKGLKNEESMYIFLDAFLKKDVPLYLIIEIFQTIISSSLLEEFKFIVETIESNDRQLRWYKNKNM